MGNTYTQIHVHLVFAVQNRRSLIKDHWEVDLHKYITGIIQSHNHKVLQINGMPDHVHILIGMRPTQALSDLMKQIKQDSSKWINKNSLVTGKFAWQAGYGAFSYSKEEIKNVIRYIQNQKIHHGKKTFQEEYKNLLEKFEVEYDDKYLLKSVL